MDALCKVGLPVGRDHRRPDADSAVLLEEQFGRDNPPPVSHPQLYYGFVGVTLFWQFMFLVIGSDPIRFRNAMIPAMLEKASFAIAIPILYALERVNVTWVGFASMDATWLVLFVIAYMRTPKEQHIDRAERSVMKRKTSERNSSRDDIARLEGIPNVGPAVAADLRQLGIKSPCELPGRDPYALYDELCRITGQRHDPCLLDTIIAAVRFMEEPRSSRGGSTRRNGSE